MARTQALRSTASFDAASVRVVEVGRERVFGGEDVLAGADLDCLSAGAAVMIVVCRANRDDLPEGRWASWWAQ
jgi:hypothetical protein